MLKCLNKYLGICANVTISIRVLKLNNKEDVIFILRFNWFFKNLEKASKNLKDL